MKNRLVVGSLFLFLSLVCLARVDLAEAQSNEGKEFIVGFLPNPLGPTTVELHLTAKTATSVKVDYPVNSPTFTTTVDVVPGDITIVSIPASASLSWPENAVGNNAVRMSANSDFIAYLINRADYTSDAALGLPVNTFNRDYIVVTNEATIAGLFAVVAAYDNTKVTITPSNNLLGGRTAGVPFEITLQRGEGYMGQEASASSKGLTGTIITADKPVGVTNGNYCSNRPVGACDHNFETAHPVQTWGNSVVAANLPNRSVGAAYRILASEDGTVVSRDGAAIGTIDRAQFIDIPQTPGDFVISADKPIFVLQIQPGSSGGDPGPIGDPAIGNLIPPEQFRNRYTFSTLPESQFPANHVIITADNADLDSITLDGNPIGAGQFSPVAGSSFSVARIAVSGGVHTTSSNNPHGVMALGYGSYDSYQFPGGAQLDRINPLSDLNSPICSSKKDAGPPPVIVAAGSDEQAEDSGIFTVELLDGAINLEIDTPPFVPGEGLVSTTVTLIDPNAPASGVVRFTDGSGNSCDVEIGGDSSDCGEINTSAVTKKLNGLSRTQLRTLRSLQGGLSRTACARKATTKALYSRIGKTLRSTRTLNKGFFSSFPKVYDTCQAQAVCASSKAATSKGYLSQANKVQKMALRALAEIIRCSQGGVCRGSASACLARARARAASYSRFRRSIRNGYKQTVAEVRQSPVQVSVCS